MNHSPFRLRNGLSRHAKRVFSASDMAYIALQYGLYRIPIWPISHSNMGHIASMNAFKGVLAGAKPPAGFYFA